MARHKQQPGRLTAWLIFSALIVALTLAATARASQPDVPVPIRAIFGDKAGVATCIASVETGGTFNRWAVGNAGERGWFQIHPVHWDHTITVSGRSLYVDSSRLFNPWYNTRVAFVMSRGGIDWSDWPTAWRCGV